MIKKVIKYFLQLLSIIFLIGLIVLVIIQTRAVKNNKPTKIFNTYYSQVLTKSMEDEIKAGSFITYKKFDEYKLDDVIVFKVENKLIVHRVIEVKDTGFITKGDNNKESDYHLFGEINDSQIIGKVTKKTTLLGLGPKMLNNKNLIIILTIIIILLLIIVQVIDIVKMYLKKEKEKYKT